MIPWKYHQLTSRDQNTDLLREWNFYREGVVIGASVSEQFQVPYEKELLINSVAVFGTGSVAAPSSWSIIVYENDPTGMGAGDPTNYFEQLFDATSGLTKSAHREGCPYLMIAQGSYVQVVLINSGGGNITYTIGLNGLLIPHGTFSR